MTRFYPELRGEGQTHFNSGLSSGSKHDGIECVWGLRGQGRRRVELFCSRDLVKAFVVGLTEQSFGGEFQEEMLFDF
ncbi:hypothetical protein TNIN_29151 [Trichonephila inaurata madagascariensis]|uniref:Uncharacterized protein n=1 Tax=Trichonephila inaurata madagascariensis TaxID=2747483 RepID=A0A8X7CCL5_9ARAC|nr:hypothetical protein TNIN_29151 [Trichonephila inaurata madagascariensis]